MSIEQRMERLERENRWLKAEGLGLPGWLRRPYSASARSGAGRLEWRTMPRMISGAHTSQCCSIAVWISR